MTLAMAVETGTPALKREYRPPALREYTPADIEASTDPQLLEAVGLLRVACMNAQRAGTGTNVPQLVSP